MIKKPGNWDSVQEFSDRPKLPLGAYVCRIKNAEIRSMPYGNQLCVIFDISEGEYAGFYKREFAANSSKDKKYKGVLRIFLPTDDGSEKDEYTVRTLKGFVSSVEKSNPGYTWNWNEASLSGRTVGILFRNEEWDYKGKTGWTVRPFRAISAESVRNQDYVIPEDKPLKSKTAEASADSGGTYSGADNFAILEDDDDKLPF